MTTKTALTFKPGEALLSKIVPPSFNGYTVSVIPNQKLVPEQIQRLAYIDNVAVYNGTCNPELLEHYYTRKRKIDPANFLFYKEKELVGSSQIVDLPESNTVWHSVSAFLTPDRYNGLFSFTLKMAYEYARLLNRDFHALMTANPRVVKISEDCGFLDTISEPVDMETYEKAQLIINEYLKQETPLGRNLVVDCSEFVTSNYEPHKETSDIEKIDSFMTKELKGIADRLLRLKPVLTC